MLILRIYMMIFRRIVYLVTKKGKKTIFIELNQDKNVDVAKFHLVDWNMFTGIAKELHSLIK